MRVKDKMLLDQAGLIEHGPVTIVCFGDSVTHGGFTDMDLEAAYPHRLWKKLVGIKPQYMPINVINAGIGGMNATNSLPRLEKQVLKHEPDLVTVCFGLNDINAPLEDYLSSLRTIFEKCLAAGAEVIFMTPNMVTTRDERQLNGYVDHYFEEAKAVAKDVGVKICDCYAKWKKLSETMDINILLANGINHPIREMHELFADSLFQTIFED